MNHSLLHALRAAGSVGIEVATGGDWKAKLPQKEAEYVTTWELSPREAQYRLYSLGYRYQPFAARKFLDGYGRDDGSYAKVDPKDRSKQFHVHRYDTADGVKVYSHHEYRVIHPVKHYRSVEYEMGEICDSLEAIVDE